MDSLDQKPTASVTSKSRQLKLVLLGLALIAAAGIAVWLVVRQRDSSEAQAPLAAGSGAPADPRLNYKGPLGNVHPTVKYVGDKTCASCHADIARSFSEHPMAKSLLPINASKTVGSDAK